MNIAKVIATIAYVLVFVGALNWGLVAFDFNLVTTLFGTGAVTKVIYILVGLAALYSAFVCFKHGSKGK